MADIAFFTLNMFYLVSKGITKLKRNWFSLLRLLDDEKEIANIATVLKLLLTKTSPAVPMGE